MFYILHEYGTFTTTNVILHHFLKSKLVHFFAKMSHAELASPTHN